MRVYWSIRKLFVLLCFVASPFTSLAQSTTSLRGTITDPSAAAIAGAVVTVTSSENGLGRRNLTDTNGEYSFLQVVPGTYKLTVERAGSPTTDAISARARL